MTPNLGQGGCSILEDVMVLGKCLGQAMIVLNGMEEEKIIEDPLMKYMEERRLRAFGLISETYLSK